MHQVGIDWAEEKHDVCVLASDGRVICEFEITHNWPGFQKLQSILESLKPFEVNIERPDGLLVDWMVSQGWAVFVTPPIIVARRRPRRSKDDRGDAYLLANLRRVGDKDSRPLVIHSEAVEELKQLTRAYDQLKKRQISTTNQLRQVLKHYYPAAVGLFTRLQGPVSLAFLEIFPTPEVSQAISREELVTFLKQHRCSNMKRVGEIYRRLQEITPKARVSTGYVCHVQALVGMLKALHQQLTRLKKQIETVLDTHPESDWWRQFPGVGVLTAAQLLAHFGDNRNQFPSYEILQATAGTVPITRRSGKKQTVQFRRACSHSLRDTVMNMARNSIRKSGWARSYYRDQLAAGHSQSRAYRALANRWLKIIWTLWQRRENYDEAYHVANRSRQGQKAMAAESACLFQAIAVGLY